MKVEDFFFHCWEFNNCKREGFCIGAVHDEKCWERAGSFADVPPVCLLIGNQFITTCSDCSYYRLLHKLYETLELAETLKTAIKNRNLQ